MLLLSGESNIWSFGKRGSDEASRRRWGGGVVLCGVGARGRHCGLVARRSYFRAGKLVCGAAKNNIKNNFAQFRCNFRER